MKCRSGCPAYSLLGELPLSWALRLRNSVVVGHGREQRVAIGDFM